MFEEEKSDGLRRFGTGLIALVAIVAGLVLVVYGVDFSSEREAAREASTRAAEARERAEEQRLTHARASAWDEVRRSKARWDALLPWLKRVTKTREAVATAAAVGMTGAAWLAEDMPVFGDGLAIGAATRMQAEVAQTMAEAQAEIAVKGPEVLDAMDALGGAFGRMLEADAAIPGDAAAIAAWNDARAAAERWDRAAEELGAILAVDVFSAGQAATVFDGMTNEMFAALQKLMPGSATSPADSP